MIWANTGELKMDKLGERILSDRDEAAMKRLQAAQFEYDAKRLREEANEIERLLELARYHC